jgi:hypothetical protein
LPNSEVNIRYKATISNMVVKPLPSYHTSEVKDMGEEDRFQSFGDSEAIFVNNAGLVLIAPFLPRLFSELHLLENSKYKNTECRIRAVRLTQFIVDERIDTPENSLVLNKLLCGMNGAASVPSISSVTEDEQGKITSMLNAILQYWKALSRTSIGGFRESFLQREGRLQIDAERTNLYVAGKAFDILIDQMPWSISIIKQPWMDRPIHVTWR